MEQSCSKFIWTSTIMIKALMLLDVFYKTQYSSCEQQKCGSRLLIAQLHSASSFNSCQPFCHVYLLLWTQLIIAHSPVNFLFNLYILLPSEKNKYILGNFSFNQGKPITNSERVTCVSLCFPDTFCKTVVKHVHTAPFPPPPLSCTYYILSWMKELWFFFTYKPRAVRC